MLSYLPSILILGLAAISAFLLTQYRESPGDSQAERNSSAKVLAIVVVLQCIHFTEEALTGFHIKLGELFDIQNMSFTFFVLFNLIWIGIWIYSVFGLRSGHSVAFFAAWFLSIAGMFNGFLHPLLSVASGSYFPGTLSSLFVGVASIVLWFKLKRATVQSMRVV